MLAMHLYHISYNDLGDKIKLKPKVPKYKLEGEECITPRVCAAPTVFHCKRSQFSLLFVPS